MAMSNQGSPLPGGGNSDAAPPVLPAPNDGVGKTGEGGASTSRNAPDSNDDGSLADRFTDEMRCDDERISSTYIDPITTDFVGIEEPRLLHGRFYDLESLLGMPRNAQQGLHRQSYARINFLTPAGVRQQITEYTPQNWVYDPAQAVHIPFTDLEQAINTPLSPSTHARIQQDRQNYHSRTELREGAARQHGT